MKKKRLRKGLQRLSGRQTRLERSMGELEWKFMLQQREVERLLATVKWNVDVLKQAPNKEEMEGVDLTSPEALFNAMYRNSSIANYVSLPGNPFE